MSERIIEDNLHWVSIDPGVTTGVAYWLGSSLAKTEQVKCGETYEQMKHPIGDMLNSFVEWWFQDEHMPLLVFEDFLLRSVGHGTTKRSGLAPVYVTNRLLGRMDGTLTRYEAVGQLAAGAKGVITNERLKSAGLYVKGEHARDAVRHGVLFMRKQQ